MKRARLVTAAIVAAVAVWWQLLPPRQARLADASGHGSVRGLLHVHSRVSDGRGTIDEIAAAAAAAGLKFLVITDHGDGTRAPVPPHYSAGVLLLDAVEISTRGGHYVAIGLPRSPYPLGGEARDVVDDVRRLGGFGIAAHPDSPKRELRWADWSLPVDGFEIINPDTSWRRRLSLGGAAGKWLLMRALLAYPARPAESIALLLNDPADLQARWTELTAERQVVAVAGADAHAKLALLDQDPGDNRFSLPIPSYESSFSSLSVHVGVDRPFSGEAAADAARLIDGLRAGRVYVAVDGWASPAAFQFEGSANGRTVPQGGALTSGSPVTLSVHSNAPAGFVTRVFRGSREVASRTEAAFELPVGAEPGTYRVEVRRPSAQGDGPAWITSNPLYVRAAAPAPPPATPLPSVVTVRALFDGASLSAWRTETDEHSLAKLDIAAFVSGSRLRLRYGLAGGSLIGQFAAAVVDTPEGLADGDALAFHASADSPMRVSLQVRAAVAGAEPERWARSVFVDAAERDYVVQFDDMTPVGETRATRPPRKDVRTVLFVIDTTNSRAGASGELRLSGVRAVRY